MGRSLLVLALVLVPSLASADPIPLPPPLPTCPGGTRARLAWPSREGYCEPIACTQLGHACGHRGSCERLGLCMTTIHGAATPHGEARELPNAVSGCAVDADCAAPAHCDLAPRCLPAAPPPPSPRPDKASARWLPALSLAPLAFAFGSVGILRRRRRD